MDVINCTFLFKQWSIILTGWQKVFVILFFSNSEIKQSFLIRQFWGFLGLNQQAHLCKQQILGKFHCKRDVTFRKCHDKTIFLIAQINLSSRDLLPSKSYLAKDRRFHWQIVFFIWFSIF